MKFQRKRNGQPFRTWVSKPSKPATKRTATKRGALATRVVSAPVAFSRTPRLYHFVKTVLLSDLVCSGALDAEGALTYNFDFGQIPGWSDLGNCFRRCRIDRLTYTFASMSDASVSEQSFYKPLVMTEVDPLGRYSSTIGYCLELDNPGVQIQDPTSDFSVSFVPAIQRRIYAGVTDSYEPAFKVFCDFADNTILHYGLKVHMKNPAVGPAEGGMFGRWRPRLRIEFTCIEPK